MVDSSKLGRMGKRRFIKTLSSIGVSGSAIRYLSQDGLAETTSDPTEEVPMLSRLRHTNHDDVENGEAPDREPVYFTLPRDEWANIKATENAAVEISERIASESTLPDLPVGFEQIVEGQQSKTAVVVDYPTADASLMDEVNSVDTGIQLVRDFLPTSVSSTAASGEFSVVVDDIPVRVKEDPSSQLQAFDSKYRPVPGGCSWSQSNYSRVGCTLGTPAYKSGQGYKLVTAGHCTNGVGTGVHQPYDTYVSDSLIGNVEESVGEDLKDTEVTAFDACYLDTNSQASVEYKLAASGSDSYQDSPVMGAWAYDQIVAWEGETEEITLQGSSSGRSSGAVNKVYPKSGNYAITVESEEGDSGGPHYREDSDGNLLIAGIHNGVNDSGAVATAMDDIETRFNITV